MDFSKIEKYNNVTNVLMIISGSLRLVLSLFILGLYLFIVYLGSLTVGKYSYVLTLIIGILFIGYTITLMIFGGAFLGIAIHGFLVQKQRNIYKIKTNGLIKFIFNLVLELTLLSSICSIIFANTKLYVKLIVLFLYLFVLLCRTFVIILSYQQYRLSKEYIEINFNQNSFTNTYNNMQRTDITSNNI